MSDNILRHFIVEETGTTRFLATLLDPSTDEAIRQVQEELWTKFRDQLSRHATTIDEKAPYLVRCGLSDPEVDLAIGWGGWLIGIENKIRSQSIRRGQLQGQYNGLKRRVTERAWGRTGFGSNPRICMVLLTPDEGIGTAEFELLQVDQAAGDRKARVTWEHFFRWLSQLAWPRGTGAQMMMAKLAAEGTEAVRTLIEKGRSRERKYPDTPTRRRFRDFIVHLRQEIERRSIDLSFPRPLHFRPDWPYENGYDIYADLDGLPGRAIYMRINWRGDLAGDRQWNLWGRVWCRLEEKGREVCKASFERLRREQVREIIEVKQGLAGHSDVLEWADIEAGQNYEVSGPRDQLSDVLASWFLAYAEAFIAVLRPQESELDTDAGIKSGSDVQPAAYPATAKKGRQTVEEDRIIATAMIAGRAILLERKAGEYIVWRYGQGLKREGRAFRKDRLDKAWRRFIGAQQSALKQELSYLTPEEQHWIRGLEDIHPLKEDC